MRRAHEEIVRRSLDWNLVKTRLSKYPQIAKLFPVDRMRRYSEKRPYYCHHLAWRLGTWPVEDAFKKLDTLLETASTLRGWGSKSSVFWGSDYGAFWSLLWELQVACGFHRAGRTVTWTTQGPDLLVTHGSKNVFVECYVYQKRFAPLEFLGELLQKLDPDIRIEYTRCAPIDIPDSVGRLDDFLHSATGPLLDSSRIRALQEEACIAYPVTIPSGSEVRNLCIYLNGKDPNKWVPGRTPFSQGDPGAYLEVSINEAMSKKARSNNIERYRPNLLLVNFALSRDFQGSIVHAAAVPAALPQLDLDSALDCMLLCVAGIDREFDASCLVRGYCQEGHEWLVHMIRDNVSAELR